MITLSARSAKNGFRLGFEPVAGTTETTFEMKFILSAFVVITLLAFNASAQPAPQSPPPGPKMPPGMATPPKPATPPKMPDKDKLSYAIGSHFANQIKTSKLDVDLATVAIAMGDVLSNRPARMTDEEVKETIMQLQQALRAKMMAEHDKELAENKAKGDEYLAKNGKLPDVKTLPSGIQYKVLTEGTGKMPMPSDSVVVNYKGKLIDGTVFDQRDGFTTPVTGRTIKGWSEILLLMKTGSKWEVTIPSDLAYGQRGSPPKIGPNSVLVFDMELVSIAPPSQAPAAHGAPPSPTSSTSSATPVVSGQIIKVPSAEELKKGAKIEVITNVPDSK
jgi:FKBP-type peptidyl-prolyl cis-trans isomerase